MKFRLEDLKPSPAKFKVSGYPDKELELCAYSLRVQLWVLDQFGDLRVKAMWEAMQIRDISKVAHYMLKDKSISYDQFLDAILTQDDRVAVIAAVLHSMGLSQPVIEKMEQQTGSEAQGNVPAPTGANTTTS